MPLYMDRHYNPAATWDAIQDAHVKDLAIQDRYGVQFLTYWFDEGRKTTFCLVSAPSSEVISDIHSAAHGSIPNDVVEVDSSMVLAFMGRIGDIPPDQQANGRPVDKAFKAIMFTDLVGYTDLMNRLGDESAVRLMRVHDGIIRASLAEFGGREVKHTGDGFMASFDGVDQAMHSAMDIQTKIRTMAADPEYGRVAVRIGLSAGEPIVESGDLFGRCVNLASRLCDAAGPGEIYLAQDFTSELSSPVENLEAVGPVSLKGFGSAEKASRVVVATLA